MRTYEQEKRHQSYLKNKDREREKMRLYTIKNRDKINEYKKNWSKLNKEDRKNHIRKSQLKKDFNLSIDGYNILLQKQNGVCAICLLKCSTGRNLCVDHDHVTKEVRGLLCFKCNTTIGRFNDNKEIIMRAFDYLNKTLK